MDVEMIIDKTVKEIIDVDFKQYAMYVLENRAIPSAIDGFKPSHRKLVYAMLNEHGSKKVKVSDLGGISKYNYHHGESSAMSAAVTLAQDWNNNFPIFTSHGNFGSRLIQEAAAPRYIYATMSKDFSKFFLDTEVALPSFDVDNPEPAFYLPIIPWVLVNGISGIAVGFAANILPRSIDTMVSETKRCLDDPTEYLRVSAPIHPTFPSFRGKVEQVSDSQWKTCGIIESTKGTEYLISELPIGFDRETYISFLNDLVGSDKIRDYSDECSETGFGFRIKVSGTQKVALEKDLMKAFKLEKIHSENLTTLGVDGKLKLFKTATELVHYFVLQRTKFIEDKIEFDIKESINKIEVSTDKIKFIKAVIDGDIDFKKTSKANLLEYISDKITPKDHGAKFVSIPLYECTTDAVKSLEDKIVSEQKNLDTLAKTTPTKLFSARLKGL